MVFERSRRSHQRLEQFSETLHARLLSFVFFSLFQLSWDDRPSLFLLISILRYQSPGLFTLGSQKQARHSSTSKHFLTFAQAHCLLAIARERAWFGIGWASGRASALVMPKWPRTKGRGDWTPA